MTFLSGKPSPDAPFLVSGQRIVEAEVSDGAAAADLPGSAGRFTPDRRVWHIFREEELWKPMAGHTAGSVDSHKQLAVWMSGVDHKIKDRG